MRLLALATAQQEHQIAEQDLTHCLPLMGPHSNALPLPDHIEAITKEAMARVRTSLPEWMGNWSRDNGLLELYDSRIRIAGWWLTPLSEMSPLRSGILRDLYWLNLLSLLQERESLHAIHWVGDDPVLLEVIRLWADKRGVRFTSAQVRNISRAGFPVFGQLRWLLTQFTQWLILRMGSPKFSLSHEAEIILFTSFPVLWTPDDHKENERMYGNWPGYLERSGRFVVYAATYSGRTFDLLRSRWREWRTRHQGFFLPEFISIRDWLQSLIDWYKSLYAYRRWRHAVIHRPVLYKDWQINRLWWRALDDNFNHTEGIQNRLLISAWQRCSEECGSLRAVFHPFEFQAIERALAAGIRLGRKASVVGIQTGMFVSNQLGFAQGDSHFLRNAYPRTAAPTPDFLVAYGRLAYDSFSQSFGEKRVCLSGPLRYPMFGKASHIRHTMKSADFPVLVATTIEPVESLALLRDAIRLLNMDHRLSLLLKFHYRNPLSNEVVKWSPAIRERIRIVDHPMEQIFPQVRAVICGGTSVGIEAIAAGCMPLVYRHLGEFSCNPMLDVPEAVFFWSHVDELQQAIRSCQDENQTYQGKRAQWASAIEAHATPLDDHMEERLERFLVENGVL